MEKPSWSTAPDWANWLAMDRHGAWYWYSHRPDAAITRWVKGLILGEETRCQEAVCSEDWRTTLEKRPTEE